jgi:hypothetical protein
MADKPRSPRPEPRKVDPEAPKPDQDEQRLRETSRPAHPDEREKDRS